MIRVTVIFLLLLSCVLPGVSQKVRTLPFTKAVKPTYILAFPSSECINCRAVSVQMIRHINENKTEDSLFFLTNDDAGAYHAELAINSTGHDVPLVIDSGFSQFVLGDKRAKLGLWEENHIYTVDISTDTKTLITLLQHAKSANAKNIQPFQTDTVQLKYNIFESYGISFAETADSNLIIYSKTNNAGALLLPENSQRSSDLYQSTISQTAYEQLCTRFNTHRFSNTTQKDVREKLGQSALPVLRIYQIDQTPKKTVVFYSFFTANSDTTLKTNGDKDVQFNLIYNLGIGIDTSGLKGKETLEVGRYPIHKKVGQIQHNDTIWQLSTIPVSMVVDGDFLYLPYNPKTDSGASADTLFYLGKFDLKRDSLIPIELIRYHAGNFAEECVAKSNSRGNPVLLNRVHNILDFGNSEDKIHLNNLQIETTATDTIKYIFDYIVLNEKVRLIGSTVKNHMVLATIENGIVTDSRQLAPPIQPIAGIFLQNGSIVTVSKSGKLLITNQYHSSKEE